MVKDYKLPNGKIDALKSAGVLASVQKGFYIAVPNLTPDGLKMLY